MSLCYKYITYVGDKVTTHYIINDQHFFCWLFSSKFAVKLLHIAGDSLKIANEWNKLNKCVCVCVFVCFHLISIIS